jgi:hypothetical protein
MGKYNDVVPEFLDALRATGYFSKFYILDDKECLPPYACSTCQKDCSHNLLPKDYGWSNNILYGLDHIIDEDVFFMGCEDHLLVQPHLGLISQAFAHVKAGIYGCVRLTRKPQIPIVKIEHDIAEIDKSYKYYVSLQPTVWSKEYLKKIIEPDLTSWQFEIIGSQNAKKIDPPAGVTYITAFNYKNLIEKGKLVENPKTYKEIHG